MGTNIRDYGDGSHIVVHTDDPKVAQRLRQWKLCNRVQCYECLDWQSWPKQVPVVAMDFFFPTSHRERIKLDLQKLGAA